MRSVSLIFNVASPVKWNGVFRAQQAHTTVCAKSGQLTKSKSSLGARLMRHERVTVVGLFCAAGANEVFTPSSEKIYFTTESPCAEPSMRPGSHTLLSPSPCKASISYQ